MRPTCPTPAQPDSVDLEQLHTELFAMVARALELAAADFDPVFNEIVARLESDFRYEEQLMETFQCADARQHREQHARMLAGLHHAAAALEQGNAAPARQAVAALRDWLPFHIETQDRHLLHAPQRHSPVRPV